MNGTEDGWCLPSPQLHCPQQCKNLQKGKCSQELGYSMVQMMWGQILRQGPPVSSRRLSQPLIWSWTCWHPSLSRDVLSLSTPKGMKATWIIIMEYYGYIFWHMDTHWQSTSSKYFKVATNVGNDGSWWDLDLLSHGKRALVQLLDTSWHCSVYTYIYILYMYTTISIQCVCVYEGCSKFFHVENVIFAKKLLPPNFNEPHVYL